MLAVVTDAQKSFVEAGCDRLVELEQELQAVRLTLQPCRSEGVRPAARQFARSLKTWLGKKLG
jgi:hypothetical protein